MKLSHLTHPFARLYALVLLIGLFVGVSLALPLPAFAQDGTGTTAQNDYSNLLNLLRALSGPLLLPVTGLLISTFSERLKWFQNVDSLVRNLISAVVAIVISIGSLLLLNWLQTLQPEVLAQVQTYFSYAFLAVSGVLARDLWHANVNKPLGIADKAKT